jgi:pyrrolidone-carboxylate peptidase
MPTKASSPAEYIAALPDDRRELVSAIRTAQIPASKSKK